MTSDEHDYRAEYGPFISLEKIMMVRVTNSITKCKTNSFPKNSVKRSLIYGCLSFLILFNDQNALFDAIWLLTIILTIIWLRLVQHKS